MPPRGARSAFPSERERRGLRFHTSGIRAPAVRARCGISGLALWLLAATGWAGDWPMFRGGPALTGVAEGNLPQKLTLLWSFKTAGPVKSSAAIVQDRVFVGLGDAKVYAIDLRSGKKLWAFTTGGAVESSPLVLEGKVVVGSSDGFLYALDAGTGKQAWKYKTEDKILGAPNWGGGRGAGDEGKEHAQVSPSTLDPRPSTLRVLVGSYDFKLHCLDLATGKSNWVYETSNFINGAPAVAESRAVFGGCDGVLRAVSLADGKQVQAVEAGSFIPASPALADGRAYFGQYENQVWCVDLKEGKKVWSFQDRDFPYFSSPAVTKERVLFGGRDKLLYCRMVLEAFEQIRRLDSLLGQCGELHDDTDRQALLVRINECPAGQAFRTGTDKFPGHAFVSREAEALFNEVAGQGEDFLYPLFHIGGLQLCPQAGFPGEHRVDAVTSDTTFAGIESPPALMPVTRSLTKKVVGRKSGSNDGARLFGLCRQTIGQIWSAARRSRHRVVV